MNRKAMVNIMKIEEAYKQCAEFFESGGIGQLDSVAFIMALNSVQKQIPKKPLKIKGEYKNKFICPACKSEEVMTGCDPFLDYGLNWCNNCGQAIDWSEVYD